MSVGGQNLINIKIDGRLVKETYIGELDSLDYFFEWLGCFAEDLGFVLTCNDPKKFGNVAFIDKSGRTLYAEIDRTYTS